VGLKEFTPYIILERVEVFSDPATADDLANGEADLVALPTPVASPRRR